MLKIFEIATGLKMNCKKTKLLPTQKPTDTQLLKLKHIKENNFAENENIKRQIKDLWGNLDIVTHYAHLGIPIGYNMDTTTIFQKPLQKFPKTISDITLTHKISQ